MKKYQKPLLIAALLALIYYFFFYKKDDTEVLDENLDDFMVDPPKPSGDPEIEYDAAGKGSKNQLKMKHSMVLLKPAIDHTPTTAGRWYGRDRGAAERAHYDTGCNFIEGPNGTFGCF